MCGITGLFGRNHDGGLDKQVKQMTVSLSHRGPDTVGFGSMKTVPLLLVIEDFQSLNYPKLVINQWSQLVEGLL